MILDPQKHALELRDYVKYLFYLLISLFIVVRSGDQLFVAMEWWWSYFPNDGMAMVLENFPPSPSMLFGGFHNFWEPIVNNGHCLYVPKLKLQIVAVKWLHRYMSKPHKEILISFHASTPSSYRLIFLDA